MSVISMDECTSIYIVLSLLETNDSTSAVELVGAFHTQEEAQHERKRLMRLMAKVSFSDDGTCDAVPNDFANNFVIKKVTNYEPVRKCVKAVQNLTPTQE